MSILKMRLFGISKLSDSGVIKAKTLELFSLFVRRSCLILVDTGLWEEGLS